MDPALKVILAVLLLVGVAATITSAIKGCVS